MTLQVEKHYAKALIELGCEKDIVTSIRNTAETLLPNLKIPEIVLFLNHPSVNKNDKKELVQHFLPEDTAREFINFLHLVIDRNLEKKLVSLIENVIDLAIQAEGFEIVTLISARLLSEEEQNILVYDLESRWSTKLFLKYRNNPNLLGGLIIQRGDKLYDGSLSGQLKKLQEILISETSFDKEGKNHAFIN